MSMMSTQSAFDVTIPVQSDRDVVSARQAGRTMAEAIGFSRTDRALLATAISELARNIVRYAETGVIKLSRAEVGSRLGLCVEAEDNGPGIADLESALMDGYSTGHSLGLGLPGTRRIVDVFEIQTAPGKGVQVKVIKWRL